MKYQTKHALTTCREALRNLEKAMEAEPVSPKTFGQHDFSGYPSETLQECLDVIGNPETLPGPLRIVKTAIERALAAKAEATA